MNEANFKLQKLIVKFYVNDIKAMKDEGIDVLNIDAVYRYLWSKKTYQYPEDVFDIFYLRPESERPKNKSEFYDAIRAKVYEEARVKVQIAKAAALLGNIDKIKVDQWLLNFIYGNK